MHAFYAMSKNQHAVVPKMYNGQYIKIQKCEVKDKDKVTESASCIRHPPLSIRLFFILIFKMFYILHIGILNYTSAFVNYGFVSPGDFAHCLIHSGFRAGFVCGCRLLLIA